MPKCTCGKCQKCRNRKATRKWYRNNKEKARVIARRYYAKNPEKMTALTKKWQAKNPEKVIAYRRKLRADAFEHYSTTRPPSCACCGLATREFLSIDHINNDGNKHRAVIGRQPIYRWLKAHSYPKGFQVLCYNCNMAKAFFKVCPHQINDNA